MSIRRKGAWFIGRYTGDGESGRAFTVATAPPEGRSYAPDKLVDVLHIKLEVSFDLRERSVRGVATHTVVPLTQGLDRVVLDCVELTVDRVTDGRGAALAHEHDGEKLTVYFRKPQPLGRSSEVAIAYHGRPRLGLYFTGPTAACPDTAVQVWSQGQDEDNRHWFPCFDYPNEKATSETLVTVPEGWTVVGNGKLLKVAHDRKAKTKTWHHRESTPHVSYLLSVACGEFAKIKDVWRGIPVEYFVKKGMEAQARRAFSQTPDMLEHFSRTFGVPYPYEKYSQVVVEDFIFGGMENISATTLIDRCLMDERAALDYEPQDLVSHELAHQWFGDLVTCKDWSHAWLNEGFATFCETVYREHWRGEEDAGYHRLLQMQSYFERDKTERRPIVTKAYTLPMELFDQHLYEKGGLVLHMLRRTLGPDLFWSCVREYLTEFGGRTVQTEDLIAVINRVTGKNLEGFFDQWVFGEGYPEFEVSYGWNDKDGTASVTVDQKQKRDEKAPPFRMPVTVRFHGKKGTVDRTVEVREGHHVFSLHLDEKPLFVRFDPGFHILKKLTFNKPTAMLKAQLEKDPDWFGRVEAAQALCREGGRDGLDAVGAALARDAFWGARVEMAAALAQNGSLRARDLLVRSLKTSDPKVRRAVARALGSFQDERAAKALVPLAASDPSYFVEGEANAGLGATRQPLAFEVLAASLRRESHLDAVRVGALTGLARLRDERAWPLLREAAKPGGKAQGRVAAMRAMASMARGRDPQRSDVRQELEGYLRDENFFAKFGAMLALESLDEPAAAAAVERVGYREADGRLRMNARDVSRALREGKSKGEEVSRLRDDLEKLREERRSLEDRLVKVEALLRKAAPASRPKKK